MGQSEVKTRKETMVRFKPEGRNSLRLWLEDHQMVGISYLRDSEQFCSCQILNWLDKILTYSVYLNVNFISYAIVFL